MYSLVVLVVAACCAHTLAFSQCKKELLDIAKANYRGSPLGEKLDSPAAKDGIVVAVTPFYFPVGVKCATTKLEKDLPSNKNYKTITTYDTFGKKTTGPKDEVLKDDVGFYTVDSEGRKVYIVPFFERDGVVGVLTCADKNSEKKPADIATYAFIKVKVDTTKPDEVSKAIADAKDIIAKVKEVADKKYGIKAWDPAFGSPEDCAKVIA